MKNAQTPWFAALFASVFIALLSARAAHAQAEAVVPGKCIRIEDERYLVEVSRVNGSITRILDKKGGLDLIREPRLADSFRFTLPIPGKEPWETIAANYIWGNQQKLSSFDAKPGKLTLHWKQPLVNYLGESFDASAAMRVELTENGILLTLKIDNATPYRIGEVFFPLVGGIQGLGKTSEELKTTKFVRPSSPDKVDTSDIFRFFASETGLGDHGPEQLYSYEGRSGDERQDRRARPKTISEPWMVFYGPKLKRFVYVGAHDPANRPKVLRLELVPSSSGWSSREDVGNWPRPSELRGEPVGASVCFVDCAGAPPNKTYEAAPVLISFDDGDWQEGKKLYQKWRKATLPTTD